jgi:cysteine desulfurase
VNRLRVDLLSLSAHKLHGPKGIGALYARKGVKLSPIVFGGGQERGLRSATENLAAIVGFVAAAEIARKELNEESMRLTAFRERLSTELLRTFPHAYSSDTPRSACPAISASVSAGRKGNWARC